MLYHYRRSEMLMMVAGMDQCGYEGGFAMGLRDETC